MPNVDRVVAAIAVSTTATCVCDSLQAHLKEQIRFYQGCISVPNVLGKLSSVKSCQFIKYVSDVCMCVCVISQYENVLSILYKQVHIKPVPLLIRDLHCVSKKSHH